LTRLGIPAVAHQDPKPEVTGSALNARVRRRLEVRGRVQGVGFRPFVYRLAQGAGLAGHVGNDPRGAFIEVEGPDGALIEFVERLKSELPPLAEIASLSETALPPRGEREFRILPSANEGEQKAEITPDTATCEDCLREMRSVSDRRHRYPFINCTNCGPRYSIIRGVPYDRHNTTMSVFKMCPACRAEYENPADRRFHAQPNACPVCGPRAWMTDSRGNEIAGDAVRLAAEWLKAGRIVAVKGLGGFHLACSARDDEAVAELRRRKAREAKPLAMMVGGAAEASALVKLDGPAMAALVSPARPIVLAPKREGVRISRHVAPASECFGVMLPYTPLHALLFDEKPGPLVMTSGNPSEEPLCCENEEALRRLGGIADGFLLHDRDIERRVDDSVVLAVELPGEDQEGCVAPIRRARGFVPAPVRVRSEAVEPIAATGGDLKSAVCLLSGREAVLSEHLGELSNPAAYRNFTRAIERFQELLDVRPEVVACDMHPGYVSVHYARSLNLRRMSVQHHHAHVVSCMAENGVTGEVVGVACDGTGYGTDGSVWGCEVLVCDEADFERTGHLRRYPLPGGDAAAVDTWRPAAGLLHAAFGERWPDAAERAMARCDAAAVRLTRQRLASSVARITETSSLGRLFDGVAFLLGLCDRNRYEAEAAMTLEAAAARCAEAAPFEWRLMEGADGATAMDFQPMLTDILKGIEAGRPVAELARAFHETVAVMLAACARRTAERRGLNRVMLTGGCFANRLLLSRLWALLRDDELDVYIHRSVPPGDGGLALGQAVAAAARLKRGIG